MRKGKMWLLGGKTTWQWTDKEFDKASDKTISKASAEYRLRELNKKGDKKKLEKPQASM